ncbi:hypothetical protein HSX10_12655 [Winogradskyella undariae]|uniref:hypothetical protein n=1 Tax=Winogradskyella TaxID=286104 RepID=UPI00156ABFB1|nr:MULTISPECIES: hypothetical protein [Winogradskyella]NRR92420.1 hypothetical protein [Winogradskyella undariae]QXP78451.1 hypothetical protein H0I32_14715 [Winogradskyella sp. HaHa_3_26]
MLEILALSYFARQIKKIAEEKGIKPGKWIAATFISWFAIEILIFIIAFAFFDVDSDGILVVMIPAVLISATVAFVILEKLKQQESVKLN